MPPGGYSIMVAAALLCVLVGARLVFVRVRNGRQQSED
jgi:hypothetical protein